MQAASIFVDIHDNGSSISTNRNVVQAQRKTPAILMQSSLRMLGPCWLRRLESHQRPSAYEAAALLLSYPAIKVIGRFGLSLPPFKMNFSVAIRTENLQRVQFRCNLLKRPALLGYQIRRIHLLHRWIGVMKIQTCRVAFPALDATFCQLVVLVLLTQLLMSLTPSGQCRLFVLVVPVVLVHTIFFTVFGRVSVWSLHKFPFEKLYTIF